MKHIDYPDNKMAFIPAAIMNKRIQKILINKRTKHFIALPCIV